MLIGLFPSTASALSLGSPGGSTITISDSWKLNDGTKVAASIYCGTSTDAATIKSNLLGETVYLTQGTVDRYSVPTLQGYVFREAIVLHSDTGTDPFTADPFTWAFLNDGKTYWHHYNSYEQGDDLTGIELGGSDKLVLCYEPLTNEIPIKISVADAAGKADNRVISAPVSVDMSAADKTFTLRVSTAKGYRAIITAGWAENDQRTNGVSQVAGADGVYHIDAAQVHGTVGGILYVTVSYQPISKIHVSVDTSTQSDWSDFFMVTSQTDPASLAAYGGERNSYAKYFSNWGTASPTYIAYEAFTASLPGADFTANSTGGNKVYIAVLTNNALFAGNQALVNLEINGVPLNLPEKYGVYVNPDDPNSALIPENDRTAETTLPSGIHAKIVLEDSPHRLSAAAGDLYQQYAYLITLTNVYEDIKVTSGHFLSTGRLSDGSGKQYAIVPRTLTGVELEYSYDGLSNWTPVTQGKVIDQTASNHETVFFRFRQKSGYYYRASVQVQAVYIKDSTCRDATPTAMQYPDGWTYLDVERYEEMGYTYSYQVLDITAAPILHKIYYDAGGQTLQGSLPLDNTAYHIDSVNTVHINNQIPVSTDTNKTFLCWRAYRTSSDYLDLYPGDTVAIDNLFAHDASPEVMEHSITLYAQWGDVSATDHKLYQYTIKVYKQNGSGYDDVTSQVLSSSARVNPVGTTVRFLNPQGLAASESVLNGYHYNTTLSNVSATVTSNNAATINLYFDQPYTLTYDPNGAAGLTGTVETYARNTEAEIKVCGGALSGTMPDGWTFQRWNTHADGSGIWVTPGDRMPMTGDLTLYAIWAVPAPDCTITYHRNASASDPNTAAAQYPNNSSVTISTLAAQGFDAPDDKYFTGWNAAADGSGTAHAPGAVITLSASLDLYAQWAAKPTVTYNANDGSGTPDTVGPDYFMPGERVNIRENTTFTRPGYTQTSWSTKSDGSGDTYPMHGGSFDMGSSDVTLYAQWTPQYTIAYDSNGGTSGTMSETSYPGGSVVSLKKNTFQKSAADCQYSFTGWNTEPNGSGISYADQQSIILNSDLTLYAQWKATCAVSYWDGYGDDWGPGYGDGITEITQYAQNSSFLVLPNRYTRDGYVFTGWATTPFSSADSNYPAGAKSIAPITGNLELFAQWAPVGGTGGSGGSSGGGSTSYTLRYASNGGTAYPDERYAANTVVSLDKTPIRAGYQFTGWYADAALTQKITSVKMSSNKTVYVGWSASTVPEMLNGDDHFAYVVGYTDGTVRPNANISRAETAVIFFRLLKPEVRDGNLTTENTFRDITPEAWCNTPISTMAALGIVKGRTADRFDPNAPITRAEFAAICARFDTGVTSGNNNFTDISGYWAEAEIKRAASLGWILGYTDGTFRPDRYITRAEAMTMINRVLCRIPEGEDALLDGMNVWPDNKPGDWHYLAVQEATNSHTFQHKGDIYERWTELTDAPNWKRYE